MNLESVELARIIKQGKSLSLVTNPDTQVMELYGFLKIYLKHLEEKITMEMKDG